MPFAEIAGPFLAEGVASDCTSGMPLREPVDVGDRVRSDGHMCLGFDRTPHLAHPTLPTAQRQRDYRRILAGAASHQVTSGVN